MNLAADPWQFTANMPPVKYESCVAGDEPSSLKDEPRSLYRYCDGNLNFATVACSEDDSEYGSSYQKKNKASRQDPMSHRIIEKRRRDRMNNCLADLSRLIPADYLKKGRGRIEKTEIIEMAIKHMKYLQQTHHADSQPVNTEHYRLGFQECMSETMRFLVEVEGFFAREALCVKLINHLQGHCEALLHSDRLHSTNPTATSAQPIQSTSNSSLSTTTAPSTTPQPRSPANNRQPVTPPNSQHSEQHAYDPSSQLRDMLSANAMKESHQCVMTPQMNHTRDQMPLTPATSVESRVVSPTNIDKHSSMNAFSIVRNVPERDLYNNYHQRQEQEHMSQSSTDTNLNSSYTPCDLPKLRYERTCPGSESENQNRDCSNGASLYKFKNNIMQRISQETVSGALSSHNIGKLFKRRKVGGENGSNRRTSSTTETYSYSEHHSSNSPTDGSHNSPPGSDYTTRVSSESDNQHRISPAGSSVSDNKQSSTRQSPKRFSHFPKHLTQISRGSHDIAKNSNGNQYGRYSPSQSSSSSSNNKHCMKNSLTHIFQNKNMEKPNFGVPIFVLHAKGSFYIPLTIDYHTLVPYLQTYNILDILPNVHNIVLHPVTINVNFQSNTSTCNTTKPQHKYKIEVDSGWH